MAKGTLLIRLGPLITESSKREVILYLSKWVQCKAEPLKIMLSWWAMGKKGDVADKNAGDTAEAEEDRKVGEHGVRWSRRRWQRDQPTVARGSHMESTEDSR